LLRRQWDESLCPVCRNGKLHDHQLQGDQMFCPVCRAMPLQGRETQTVRWLIGRFVAVCPHCNARFDIENGGRATLEEYKEYPLRHRRGARQGNAAHIGMATSIATPRKVFRLRFVSSHLCPSGTMTAEYSFATRLIRSVSASNTTARL
jgi:hypothetical protein